MREKLREDKKKKKTRCATRETAPDSDTVSLRPHTEIMKTYRMPMGG